MSAHNDAFTEMRSAAGNVNAESITVDRWVVDRMLECLWISPLIDSPELRAIDAIDRVLSNLTADEARRVASWASDRFGRAATEGSKP